MSNKLFLLPLVIAAALFMENMDSTVIATSLPAIAVDIGVNPISLKLTFTAYLLSLAVFVPISGWTADRFGARLVFRAAILVFTIGSIACAFSSTLPGFVLARTVQGLGGAMMVPVGRLVILRSVPKSDLVRALSYLTIPALIGPIVGPLIGGYITTNFHWRWIFWINVPFGVAALILATIFLPDLREDNPPPLDAKGFVLSGIGLSTFVFGLSTMAERDLLSPPAVAGLLAVGAAFLTAYAQHARVTPHPIIDLSLLAVPTFGTSTVGGFLFRTGIGATPFLLPLLLQLGFGLSAFQSGEITFVTAAGAFLMKFTAQPILRRIGFRKVLIVNALVSSLFLGATALFTPQTSVPVMLGVLFAGGFFRSLQFTSLNAIAYAEIGQDRMSSATSFASVVQQLSGAVGVAFAALVLEITQWAHGGAALGIADFAPAFVAVALVSAASVLFHRLLPKNAGEEISGHHKKAGTASLLAMQRGEGGADRLEPAGSGPDGH
ncbi:DHA2 family efflux MFS transporter permease subunit [Methylovirgula sp. 4M-Z18]|uniref:DHA2 family efflux MFS transporter permease subunit n=1 Tax=Methylovirgula sp. 4M-Z18 TaxID=2293567 RepID=UPI000E2E8E15|nr:DHA2 family efflux MFS transporter permease subunit [Methylovirgula sp. 4M-Z18]RFB79148.1 DHA2 family efflux MFS transporter permease subunit [Methylovirgula sp. 4M-Z18]